MAEKKFRTSHADVVATLALPARRTVNIWRHRPLGRAACALAAITLLVAAAGPAPADAKPTKRPDLVVKSAELTVPASEPDLGFIVPHGGTTVFAWKQTTKNKGKATAPKSRSGVQIVIDSTHVVTPARTKIPKLAPGDSHTTHGGFEMPWDPTWDYGTYPTRICADVTSKVTESKEGKNCRDTHTIWVVPTGFTGTISGEAVQPLALPGVTLSWEFPAGAAFVIDEFQPFPGEGIFRYSFRDPDTSALDLRYTISGTNELDGCTWQGTGGYPVVAEFHHFELGFARGFAHAHALIPVDRGLGDQFHFPATVTCVGGGTNQVDVIPANWGRAAWWFDTGPTGSRFPDPGLTVLNGDYTDSNATYHWNLIPNDMRP